MNHLLTPEQLIALTNKYVDKRMFKSACKDPYFKQFLKILIFMQLNCIEGAASDDPLGQDPSVFGHTLTSRAQNGRPIRVDIDIKLTPAIVR